MPKGLYSQCFCLLTNGLTAIDDVATVLEAAGAKILKRVPGANDWQFGGPALVIAYRPEQNGYVVIDVVNRPWPDAMGDSKTDAMTFGAWTMGQFGPFAYPKGLLRASQNSWRWEGGKTIAAEHRGFVRIRMSYSFGAREDTKVLPEEYDPVGEMQFLTRGVRHLLKTNGVLCYFNPNGEVLRDAASFKDEYQAAKTKDLHPLPLWTNVRLFKMDAELSLLDTVGSHQLDVPDVEAIFRRADYELGTIADYLRNVTLHLLKNERAMQTGEPIDGPGERNLSWMIEALPNGSAQPPRQTLRLFPRVLKQKIQDLFASH